MIILKLALSYIDDIDSKVYKYVMKTHKYSENVKANKPCKAKCEKCDLCEKNRRAVTDYLTIKNTHWNRKNTIIKDYQKF